jgi:tetratricopeptide (TPR) repeat protein
MKNWMTKGILFSALFSFILITGINAQDDAKTAASLYNEGLAKAKEKAYLEALDLMEQAIAKATEEENEQVIDLAKKNGTRAAYGAGNIHRKAGDHDQALAAFEKGIEYNPAYYTNYVGKAQTLEGKGSKKEAIIAYLAAADVAAKANKADKAAQYVKKSTNMIAKAKSAKDWANTQAYAEAFLEVKESADVHYYLASALKESGDSAKAIEHLDKACEMAKGDASKYYYLKAQTHEKLGQKESAVAAYKKVTDAKYTEMAQYKIGELGG